MLYLARMGRLDLLWSVSDLARNITTWSVAFDKGLHRLISYTECTKDWVQTCIVGDRPEQCEIAMCVDASFVGGQQGSKSTSGAFLFLCVSPGSATSKTQSLLLLWSRKSLPLAQV